MSFLMFYLLLTSVTIILLIIAIINDVRKGYLIKLEDMLFILAISIVPFVQFFSLAGIIIYNFENHIRPFLARLDDIINKKIQTKKRSCKFDELISNYSNELLNDLAIRKEAESIVKQWDNHDKYRETEADKALYNPSIGEPSDVAIARHLLKIIGTKE